MRWLDGWMAGVKSEDGMGVLARRMGKEAVPARVDLRRERGVKKGGGRERLGWVGGLENCSRRDGRGWGNCLVAVYQRKLDPEKGSH